MEDKSLFQSEKPGHLSPESFSRLGRKLEDKGERGKDALDLFLELSGSAKTGIDDIQSKIWSALRHLVYELGIAGDVEDIGRKAKREAMKEQRQEGLIDPFSQEHGEAFAERMRRIRTEICLRALAQLGDDPARRELGMLRARFKMTDAGHSLGKQYVDTEGRRLKSAITEQLPTNELLDILRLAEDENHSEFMELVRGTALEFLIRRLVTTNSQLIERASKFFTSRYIDAILNQMPDSLADGRIGGKSTGVLLAYAALEQDTPEFDEEFDHVHNFKPGERVERISAETRLDENESRFIGSRVFEQVINKNSSLAESSMLKRFYINGKSAPPEMHFAIQAAMLEAKFPEHLERQLRGLFLEMHGRPLIVRSSSELEDRIGAAFAGKYESVELANSGADLEADFDKFKEAILTVYASVFSRDVMEYRKQHGLLIDDEEMGILVQFLNGDRHGTYFYPDLAIVAMSRATQSMGQDPSRGAMTVVAGLGEQAVKSGGRYVMLAKPKAEYGETRPQAGMTVINLTTQSKETAHHTDLVTAESLSDAIQAYGLEGSNPKWQMLSLKGVTEYTEIPLAVEYIVQKLKYQLGYDVDCEFTIQYDGKTKKFNVKLVQCRPQTIPENMQPSKMPAEIPQERVLMKNDEAMNATYYSNISHLVWISPEIFQLSPVDRDVRKTVAAINALFDDKKGKYMIVAPLRWGSEEESSGLKASFADFSNAAGVMEVFPNGHISCSWGTHFLQDFMDGNMTTGAFTFSGVNFPFFEGAGGDEKSGDVGNDSASRENTGGDEEVAIPEILKPYVKFIDVNAAYEKMSGLKSEKGWCVHVAQDNSGDEKSGIRPSRVYIGETDKDLPEKTA